MPAGSDNPWQLASTTKSIRDKPLVNAGLRRYVNNPVLSRHGMTRPFGNCVTCRNIESLWILTAVIPALLPALRSHHTAGFRRVPDSAVQDFDVAYGAPPAR